MGWRRLCGTARSKRPDLSPTVIAVRLPQALNYP